ncbi:T9SS type A sorting domain-containing protein [Aquimarina latercula]|uniref:T9SS type A sorting domain-containing protein n=1 Tax=Aquimarina latercula TaxID=987 RepID=UPI000411AE6E|nr:T9SS type A sorting domain-containing protein [Aquimarina latercula]
MKKLIIFLTFSCIVQYGFSQVSVNPIVECPPCRPISGCGVCWENQQQANNCEINRSDDFDNIKESQLTVYPSPIKNGNFSITYNREITGKIKIVNQLGAIVKIIEPSSAKSNHMTINVNLEAGLYFMIYYDTKRKEKITKKLLFTK